VTNGITRRTARRLAAAALLGLGVLAILAQRPVHAATPSAGYQRPLLDRAAEARGLEDLGAYARAVEALKALRASQPLDADLEIALSLDEARSGMLDSAAARLRSPLLDRAAVDSMPVTRRDQYSWRREGMWVTGAFEGWYWYVWRARAEVQAALGHWDEALAAARECVAARPLSGKEWLVLAVCAGRSGHDGESRTAAEEAMRRDPTLPEAAYLAGLWSWRSGRRAEAAERFRAAVTLDSSYHAAVLASVRMRIPGSQPDSLPSVFFVGARAPALVTSSARPKLEEFVQMDSPARVLSRTDPPIPDSLLAKMKPNDLHLQVLIDASGHVVLHELPWFTSEQLHPAYLAELLHSSVHWTFLPARLRGEAAPVWATISYNIRPTLAAPRSP